MGKTQLLRRLLVDSGAVVALICRHRYASHSYGLEREKEGGGAAGGDCPVTLTGIPLRFLSPFPLTGPPPLRLVRLSQVYLGHCATSRSPNSTCLLVTRSPPPPPAPRAPHPTLSPGPPHVRECRARAVRRGRHRAAF